jgi:hypothetical protein
MTLMKEALILVHHHGNRQPRDLRGGIGNNIRTGKANLLYYSIKLTGPIAQYRIIICRFTAPFHVWPD